MIKNQWYAILSSNEVKSHGLTAVRRFGEKLILFRNGNGDLACVTDGCLKNGNIQCPFHGIEYDVTGKCVYIPSEGRASTGDYNRFNLKHYATREIGGIVFAWYGEGTPDHEPDVFDVITDPRFSYDHMNDTWGVQYSRVIENQLDVSHLAFVHYNTIGRGNRALVNGPKVIWLNENTLQTSADNEVDSGQTPRSADDSVIKNTNLTFKFPNMWLNHVTDKIMILALFIPVDDETSIIALRFYNRITGVRAIDKFIARLGSVANKVIERQDKRIVETQLPKASALHMRENLVAADLPIMEYRRRRYELQLSGRHNGNNSADLNVSRHPTDNHNANDDSSHKINQNGLKGERITMDNKAMFKLSYGLFVLTAKVGDKENGCITNTAIQVASEPNQISFAVNKANYTHDMLMQSDNCNISVISEAADFDLFKHFGFQSGRDVDKFAGFTDCEHAENGIPYITKGTNAYFSIAIKQRVDLGSHTLFIGEPTAMEVLSEVPSATYNYYQSNIKPKPEAPKADADALPPGMHKWRCKICGYEYVGETLPDDFICPICKHPASDFEQIA